MGFINTVYGQRIKVGDRYFYIIRRGSRKVLKSGNMFSSSFGTIYSIINTESIFTGSYPDFFLPLPGLYKNPKVLIIGLAGGTIPYQLTKKYGTGISIDVVEVDKEMAQIPKIFLGEHKQSWSVHIGDGMEFVQKVENKYDLIILDAYNEDVMPDEFVSYGFVKAAHSALTKNGILAINLTTKVSVDHYSGLMKKLFGVYAYPSELGNSFVIGSKHFDIDAIKREAKNLYEKGDAEYIRKVYMELKQM